MISGVKQRSSRIIFVTGTDTGVGKTLFTGLLLHHLRETGCHALAIKPFCSGDRSDAVFLQNLQGHELDVDEVNPFYFPEPVAPLLSARKHRRKIDLSEVVQRIRKIAARCECLLIEGSGGLLVPLGKSYSVRDIITQLDCEIVVIARNRLGTINHTLLTAKALRDAVSGRIKIVLMNGNQPDLSSPTNPRILRELLSPIQIYQMCFLGENAMNTGSVKKSYKKVKKMLARVFD